MTKILITGAGGFIGKAAFEYFTKKGYEVTGLDNYARNSEIYSKVISGSVFDQKIMDKLVNEADTIIHMAAINGTRNFYDRPSEVFEVSCRGALNLYDSILRSNKPNDKRIFIASSGEVYAQPATIPTPEDVELKIPDINNNRYSYGGGKITQDLIAKHLISKIATTTIFRPHNVYGPNMGFDHVIPELTKKAFSAKKTIEIEGDGSETRSFCFINDFINGLEILLNFEQENNFEIYNIGNDEESSIADLVKIILKELNKESLEITKTPIRKGGTTRRCPDISKLKKIGYSPLFDIKIGIREFLKNDKTLSNM